ncbi:hypothetical protein [Enterococcus sp. LJL51]|uniref:hypothetical protein n=1 Tax=Enterococcus sp. LJL51 TaxID=3416656 RepID=UPI003CEDB16A
MDKIEEFIVSFFQSNSTIATEHLDFFIDKETFNYLDTIVTMNKIKKYITEKQLDDIKIIGRINCGTSERKQVWNQEFWRLVDVSIEPPLIVIGRRPNLSPYDFIEKLDHPMSSDWQNYSVVIPDENRFSRYLLIMEGEHEYAL